MRYSALLLPATLLLFCASVFARTDDRAPLRTPDSFAALADPAVRSVALFEEAGRVIQHPRCVNCHPVSRRPTQGDAGRPHLPPVFGGPDGMHGTAALPCSACHHAANATVFSGRIRSIPGDPHWALAPAAFAWQGKSLGQICRQIKDPARNGGRTLEQIRHHMAEDGLVGWAWHPGEGRTPAPGTQAGFGALIEAWIKTGAACPADAAVTDRPHTGQ